MEIYELIFINIGLIEMISNDLNTEFWVITDTHLIADSLHDNGKAFKLIQDTSQGKDLNYQEVALTAFCKMANEKKPSAIIVTGDVTFNGELLSALRFQEIFSKLTDTKILLLPGNHDIFDGWARKFKDNQQLYAKQISPDNWQQIFTLSYDCALDKDNNSLAYSVQLNPQYLLLLLDSNTYGYKPASGAPKTAGKIGTKQLSWLKKQLEYAHSHHLRPLLFMHHNLYVHNPAVNQGFVLDNAPAIRQLCQQYNVKVVFSGHIHAQNIIGPQKLTPTTEIVTSSFCSYDQAFGVVKVSPTSVRYDRKKFNMIPFLTKKQRQNYVLTHFHEYLKKIQLRNLSKNSDQKDPLADRKFQPVNKLLIEMNYNYFTGHNHISRSQLNHLYSSTAFQTLLQERPRFSEYLKTLYDTTEHTNLVSEIKY